MEYAKSIGVEPAGRFVTSPFGVKTNTFKGYCWPQPGKEFRWSSWADWRKLKPLCRISFKHNDYNYGVSISTYDDNFDNRLGTIGGRQVPFRRIGPQKAGRIVGQKKRKK